MYNLITAAVTTRIPSYSDVQCKQVIGAIVHTARYLKKKTKQIQTSVSESVETKPSTSPVFGTETAGVDTCYNQEEQPMHAEDGMAVNGDAESLIEPCPNEGNNETALAVNGSDVNNVDHREGLKVANVEGD